MKILEEFDNLSQGDDRFEGLRSGLLFYNSYLPKSYSISCYINGLKWEIKSLVKSGRPKELVDAMELAMFHSKSIPATQELARQTNRKPISSISALTETEIPNSTSTEIDVLGEGQTIQESVERDTIKRQEGINRKIDALIEWVTNRQTGAELFRSKIVSQSGQGSEASVVDKNQWGAPVVDKAFSDDDDDLQKSQALEALSQESGDAEEVKAAYGDELESSIEETNPVINESSNNFQFISLMTNGLKSPENTENNKKESQAVHNESKVNSCMPTDSDYTSNELDGSVANSFEQIKFGSDNFRVISIEIFGNSIAPKVYVEMYVRAELAFVATAAIVEHWVEDITLVFDPGIVEVCTELSKILKTSARTELKAKMKGSNVGHSRVQAQEFEMVDNISLAQDFEANIEDLAALSFEFSDLAALSYEFSGRLVDRLGSRNVMPFDRGKEGSVALVLMGLWKLTFDLKIVVILVFDPGGSDRK